MDCLGYKPICEFHMSHYDGLAKSPAAMDTREQFKIYAKEQKLKEMEKLIMEAMSMTGDVSAAGRGSEQAMQETLNQRLERRISDTERSLIRMREAKEELSKLQVSEGDAAFHPEHGNVLIRVFSLGDCTTMGNVKKEHDGKVLAQIVTTNSTAYVLASELVPITEATKILYGKK